MTRDEASLSGLKHYFTGTLCSNGHLDWRYVCNGGCRSCMKPPEPAARWNGEDMGGRYRYVVTRRLRIPALPPLQDAEQMQRFDAWLEKYARQWLVNYGYWQAPTDEPL